MDSMDLFKIAEKEKIPILYFSLPKTASCSVKGRNGDTAIGIDCSRVKSTADFNVRIAHELGHCTTGSFYNPYSPFDSRLKHERRANKWAAENLVPFSELVDACRQGTREVWELAEYFGVTEDFIRTAIDIYASRITPESQE